MKFKFVLLFLFFVMPSPILAECYGSDVVSERVYINKIISNIDITSFHEEINGDINFSIRIANLHPSVYIIENTNRVNFNYGSNPTNPNEVIYSGFKAGQKLSFSFFAKNTSCINDELISTQYITLPYFNKYYNDPVCIGASEFHYCKKWVRNSLPYDKFKEAVENYKYVETEKPEEGDNKSEDIVDLILRVVDKYYIPVLGSIIVFGTITIIVTSVKKNDFGF